MYGAPAAVLMTYMSDDCVFETASGPEVCGTRHAGRERVREAFASFAFRDGRIAVKSSYFKNRTA